MGGPFSRLFFALLVLFVTSPLHTRSTAGLIVADAVSWIVLGAGVGAVSGRRPRLLVAALGLAAVAVNVAAYTGGGSAAVSGHHALKLAVVAVTAGALLVHVLRIDRITGEELFAAASVFLLIGVGFAFAYSLSASLVPDVLVGAVTEGSGLTPGSSSAIATRDTVYFSFVTLTTLGYGDILPGAPISRMLATLEAVIGQLYLAFLIARLVGLHLSPGGPSGGTTR
jgi:hypothetical protein